MTTAKKRSKKVGSKKKQDSLTTKKNGSTLVWSEKVESGDYIKLPRCLLRMWRYKPELVDRLSPRHMMLLLNLASRKYKDREIRVHWAVLGEDLGVSSETVRKWAYELRNCGLIGIKRYRQRDDGDKRLGTRNDANGFDLTPFVRAVDAAYKVRELDRQHRNRSKPDGVDE